MRLIPVLLLSAAGAATIVAQQQNPTGKPHDPAAPQQGTRDPAPADASKLDDGILATWLLVENDNEVALSQIALQRAQDPEVKQFAQRMVDDHGEMGRKLRTVAGAAGFDSKGVSKGDAKGDAKGGDDDGDVAHALERSPGHDIKSGLDHVALLRELGIQCLLSARTELESKQGAEFEQCYVGMMIGGHFKVNDQMTVFQRHASPEFKSALAEGQKTVQMHLDEAKQLVKRLQAGAAAPAKK